MRKLIKGLARRLGYDLRLEDLTVGTRIIRQWETDEEFLKVYEKVKGHSAGDQQRAYMLYQFAKGLKGNIAEVGVYLGGTSMLMALCAPKSTIHSFDTFAGMPQTNPDHDLHVSGDFEINDASVLHYLNEAKNIQTYRGFFPDTARPVEEKVFRLVHIDVDIYRSYKDCLEFFYPRMEAGGVIICDDYGFTSCPGAKEAWDEFFTGKEQSIYLPTGQAFIVRSPEIATD